ncbi:CDK5 regulatory subunit associated protein 1 [Scenedesmus sp. NREL 46B-D3]|nr:CDK5 regulatory subunit associated protein 1 [Scenedesmus sp. NREL 46B-D3]
MHYLLRLCQDRVTPARPSCLLDKQSWENAEARIWGRLGELQAEKKRRRASKQHLPPIGVLACTRLEWLGAPLTVGVLGCMAERLKAKLLDSQRLADLVVGPDAYRDLPRILAAVQVSQAGRPCRPCRLCVRGMCPDRAWFVCRDLPPGSRAGRGGAGQRRHERAAVAGGDVRDIMPVRQDASSSSAFVSIMRGCNNMCAFCIVPFTRGRERSVYKPKRQGAIGFGQLLESVARVNPEMRVRFTSPHPKDFTHDVLGVISELPNVCNYLHMPAQSGSSSTLQRMRRGYSREAYDALVGRARQVVPNVALSTDIIAGFCGETDEEHQATADLLLHTRYDNAFIFAYSQRDKTHAARHLADDVPAVVKSQRLADLFAAYRQGQAELNRLEVGRLHLVLLDGRPRRDGQQSLQGRTCSMKRVIIPEQPSWSVLIRPISSSTVAMLLITHVDAEAVAAASQGGVCQEDILWASSLCSCKYVTWACEKPYNFKVMSSDLTWSRAEYKPALIACL